jgi:hypothetical protein
MPSLFAALNVSIGTLRRLLKAKRIRSHSNAIKPSLTEENKRNRLQICISMFNSYGLSHDPGFKGMYNIIHIDEKWFYMTKKSKNYFFEKAKLAHSNWHQGESKSHIFSCAS